MARRSPSWKDFKDLGSICWKDLNVQDTTITISSEEGGNYAFLEAFFHGICIMRGHEWFLEKLEPLIWDPQFTAEVQEPEGASGEIVFNVGELVYDRIMDELNFALYDYYAIKSGRETLSRAYWRALRHPATRWPAVLVTTGLYKHLMFPNLLPQIDPLNRLAEGWHKKSKHG